jgi:uncharacterized membrane protein AbrB (regulator of aidB expression)
VSFVEKRPRDAEIEIRQLEELWAASPSEPPAALRLWGRLSPWLGRVLAVSWIAFFVAGAFAPAADAEAATPLWAGALIGGVFVSLFAALVLSAMLSPRAGFAAAAVAGGLGVALSVGCRTTEHHTGSWWLYELGATLFLTGLALLGLKRQR